MTFPECSSRVTQEPHEQDKLGELPVKLRDEI